MQGIENYHKYAEEIFMAFRELMQINHLNHFGVEEMCYKFYHAFICDRHEKNLIKYSVRGNKIDAEEHAEMKDTIAEVLIRLQQMGDVIEVAKRGCAVVCDNLGLLENGTMDDRDTRAVNWTIERLKQKVRDLEAELADVEEC